MVAALEEALEVVAVEIPMLQAGVFLGSRNIIGFNDQGKIIRIECV